MTAHATTTIADPPARRVRFTELDRQACDLVVARNHVARVAFIADGRVELHPIHYVYGDGVLYGRTAVGKKYLTWLVDGDVVVEIDESDDLFDWRSVIIRGSLRLLRSSGSREDRLAYARAIERLRSLVPEAFTPRDPTPDRGFVFRITPIEMTGRKARRRYSA